jgi:hypothetical protein
MTILFDSSGVKAADTSNSGTSTLSFTNTAGDFMVVAMFTNGSPTISSFQYNGVSLTQKAGGPWGGNFRFWTLLGPATGTNNLTLNYNAGGSNFIGWVVATYSGVKQSGFPNAQNTVQSRGSVNSWNEDLTDTTAGAIAIQLVANIRAISAGAGTNLRVSDGNSTNYQLAIGDDIGNVANPHNLAFTTAVGGTDVYDWMFSVAEATPPLTFSVQNPPVSQLVIRG